MWSLYKKEIVSFFSSLTGYLVVGVFLVLSGLFLWVIPGQLNILFGGYASLDSLFYLAPWLYLFLVPAVTMRLLADEKRIGTIELLFTRPISEMQIIAAKYLAGLTLVLISLLPTLIYYFSVYQLGSTVGNIDTGGTNGSYIGLFFLAAIYVAIGIFCSALSDNQVVAFVLSVLFSFLFYFGFDALADVLSSNSLQSVVLYCGIDSHYQSISRGVVDTRDIVYFITVIGVFLFAAKTVLLSRKW